MRGEEKRGEERRGEDMRTEDKRREERRRGKEERGMRAEKKIMFFGTFWELILEVVWYFSKSKFIALVAETDVLTQDHGSLSLASSLAYLSSRH